MKISIFLAFSAIILTGNCYKILAVFPFGSVSHYSIGEATLKALTDAGHDVTMISALKTKKPSKNFKEIIIPDAMKAIMGGSI